MKAFIGFLGRVAISLIFIFSAIHKGFHWAETHQQFLDILNQWQARFVASPSIHAFLDVLIPLSPIILLIAVIFEGLGGLLVLLGVQPRTGALLLVLFLIPVTLVYHAFWTLQGQESQMQMIMFMKNLSIFGGLLILLAYGGKSKPSKSTEE